MTVELITTVSGMVGGWLMKFISTQSQNMWETFKLGMTNAKLMDRNADNASKRSSPVARKVLAYGIMLPMVAALIAAAFINGTDVSILHDTPQKSFLFGLIKWGSTAEVISMPGLAFPPWLSQVLCLIGGFFFGSGGAKPMR